MKVSRHALARLRAEATAYREMQTSLVTGLVFEPGALGFRLKNEVIGLLGGALAEVFRDMTAATAGNYVEMEMTQAPDANAARVSMRLDRFTLTVQKNERPTPTMMRMRAEYALLDLLQAASADPAEVGDIKVAADLKVAIQRAQDLVDNAEPWNVRRKARYLLHQRIGEALNATYAYMREQTRPDENAGNVSREHGAGLQRKPAPGAWALYDAVLELKALLETQLGLRAVGDEWDTVEGMLARQRP